VATFLVDAIAELDVETVRVAAGGLRDAAGRADDDRAEAHLLGLLEVAHVAGRQLQSEAAVRSIEPASVSARFVATVGRHPGVCNSRIEEMLGIDETQVSRAGRRLVELGLAVKRRVGRQNAWVLTPAGRAVAEQLAKPAVEPVRVIGKAPPRNERFVDRPDVFDCLESVEQGFTRQVLTGFAGLGKSQVAAEFVYRNYNKYVHVWWLRGSSLLTDFAELAKELSLPAQERPDLRAVAEDVRNWLESTEDSWLLVIDGAEEPDDVKRLLPSTGPGRVLVTSRARIWGADWHELALGSLSEREACAIVASELPARYRHDRDIATLARMVQFQPLALRQAGAYIRERELGSVSAYIDLLANEEPTRQSHDLLGFTSALNFEALRNDSPLAARLMSVLLFLGPDELMADEAARIDVRLEEPGMLEDAFRRLSAYALADITSQAVRVHPLVQRGLSQRMDHVIRQDSVADAIRVVKELIPAQSSVPEYWPICERLFPHAVAATSRADLAADQDVLGAASEICARLADYLQTRARFPEAKRFNERALYMAEIGFGLDSVEVARRLRRHGEILRDLGDVASAEDHITRAVQLATVLFDVRERFDAENSLGSLLRDKGDPASALKRHERALGILDEDRHGVLGELDRAIACASLARAHRDLGNVDDARQFFEGAIFLKIDHALCQNDRATYVEDALLLGDTSAGSVTGQIETARTRIAFAALLLDIGNLDVAERHLGTALKVLTIYVGDADPFVARAHLGLGWLHRQRGQLDEAQRRIEMGVAGIRACFGAEHHEVGRGLLHLGFVLWDLDDFEGARKAFEQAVALIERSFGCDHPDVARAFTGLGLAIQDAGDLSRAREYHQRAVDIFQSRFGRNHLEVATAMDKLGYTVRELGDPAAARELHEEALQIITNVLAEHRRPDQRARVMPLVNLARALRDLNEFAMAKEYVSEALELLDPTDRDAGIVHLVLGQIERDADNQSEAESQFRQSLSSFVDHFGENHRDVAAAWREIGVTEARIGKFPEARTSLEHAIAILRQVRTVNPRQLREAAEDLALVEQELGLRTVMPTAIRDRVGRLVGAGTTMQV